MSVRHVTRRSEEEVKMTSTVVSMPSSDGKKLTHIALARIARCTIYGPVFLCDQQVYEIASDDAGCSYNECCLHGDS